MAARLHLWILLLAISACKTAGEAELTEAPDAQLRVAGSKAPSAHDGGEAGASNAPAPSSLEDECPVEVEICTEEFDPTVCTATVYDGKTHPLELAPKAWGSNRCYANLKLRQSLCARGLVPSKLEVAECIPDATNGHCPVEETICTMEYLPTRCAATVYAGQKLGSLQQPVAWGSNPCQAKTNLKTLACQLNLDPESLAEIICEPSQEEQNCPPTPPSCEKGGERTVCRAELGREKLEAAGVSACEARWRLERLACAKGQDPQGLRKVSCQSAG